jgi:hypothetical protein
MVFLDFHIKRKGLKKWIEERYYLVILLLCRKKSFILIISNIEEIAIYLFMKGKKNFDSNYFKIIIIN